MQDINAIAQALIAAAEAAVLDGEYTGHAQPVEESIAHAVAGVVAQEGYEVLVGRQSFPLRNGVRGLSVTVRPPAVRRETFDNNTPLFILAYANPWVDHFHVVEVVDGKEHVFHFEVWRKADGSIEVVNEQRANADNERGGPGAKVIGDEAHD